MLSKWTFWQKGCRHDERRFAGNCEREWDHISPTVWWRWGGERICLLQWSQNPLSFRKSRALSVLQGQLVQIKVFGHRSKEALGSKETWDSRVQSIGRWSSLSMNLKYSGNCVSLNKHWALSIKRKTARLYPPGFLDSASVSGPGWFSTGQERGG